MTITKSDGTRQVFEEEKLASSLAHAGAAQEIIDEIVEEVEHGMKDGMNTTEIYGRAFELLKKHSRHIAVKYSIRRAIMELGPDGFPFEKFVARIFQSWNYETMTDQTVMGSCISHEIDVIAWDKKKLIMCEAKFHNEFGLKSDVKVALYIKSRWDDVATNFYDYGGIKRKLSEFWLVTNTKFTEQAIAYGECKNLKMIGWNYPQHGNLHDLIEENGLHPITCLTSLSNFQKKDLIGRNILVCTDLIKRPEMLKVIGLKDHDVERVVEESKIVIQSTDRH